MRNSKIKLAALLLCSSVLLMGTGCKKQLDINTNPNFPSVEQGTPALLFPAGVQATSGKVGADLAIVGGIWAQYFTQSAQSSQYKPVDTYNMPNTDNFVNDVYTDLYSKGLINYQAVINTTRASGDWNTFLMAQVMACYTQAILVDLYDMVPYTQALQSSGNLNPTYDDGYAIYTSLISRLDSALSMDFASSTNTNIGTQDLIFEGDISKWKLFANTLKLKLFLRMVNAHPDVAQAGIKALLDAGTPFLDVDAQITNYSDAPAQDNPFFDWNQRALNTTANLRASGTFVLWLNENGDPRVVGYFGKTSPDYVNQGDFSGSNTSYQTAAVFVQHFDDPVQFISAAESYFMQAEAELRYGNQANVKALYDLGVLTAFSYLGNDGAPFIAPGGAYEWGNELEGGVALSAQAQISRQKWASFAYGCHQVEGFFEKNRTGFPATSPVYSTDPSYIPGQFVVSISSTLGGTDLPKRFVYPYDETSRNPNAPQSVVPISTPVWWAL